MTNKRKKHFLYRFIQHVRSLIAVVIAAGALGGHAWGQVSASGSDAAKESTPLSPLSPLSSFESSAAASETPAADPTVPVGSSPEGCRILTDKAMAADLRAATAQSQKNDPTQLGRLLDESIGLWTLATERCTDRAQERARRNLSDSHRTRQVLSAELGSGPECNTRQKDANSLQDLAQQAVKERRWLDASVMYRKAENMWDVAAERCTGEPQRLAVQRRDQTATDAHNAEFCAPKFERARDATQTLGRQNDLTEKTARQTLSQMAETLWRDAMTQCKGAPLDIARNNAQRLAKERGTAWVPTRVPEAGFQAIAGGTPTSSAPVSSAPTQTSVVGLPALAKDQGTQNTPIRTSQSETSMPNTGPQDTDIQSGNTRFQGRFARTGDLLTGSGRVTWANGDVYNGALVDSKRQGQGEFVWASGQRYKGDWVQDVPQGQGSMKFANGNQYEGEVSKGLPHGDGRMMFASGDIFQGHFVHGKPNGSGTYRWTSGQTYQGPWAQDNPNGIGKLVYANGNMYEGALVNGAPDGLGKLVYASGDEYRGQFTQGNPHGEGTYTWKAGDRYSGQWQAGRKHGQGRFEWPNGDHWAGMFENDVQTDKGKLTRKTP